MDLVVPDRVGAPLLSLSCDPVAHLPELGLGLDVHMNEMTRAFPLVPLHRRNGFKGPQSPQSETAGGTGDGRKWGLQEPGAVTKVQVLKAELHDLLQLLRIERPPLGAANAPSIRQR